MANPEKKNFDSPDETRPFADKGQALVLHLGDRTVAKGTFEPGWRWSEHVKPIAGTDSCQFFHRGYVLSGRMKVVMNDGGQAEVGPGDVMSIPPGHDAEVVGNEPCVVIDWGEISDYAKGS